MLLRNATKYENLIFSNMNSCSVWLSLIIIYLKAGELLEFYDHTISTPFPNTFTVFWWCTWLDHFKLDWKRSQSVMHFPRCVNSVLWTLCTSTQMHDYLHLEEKRHPDSSSSLVDSWTWSPPPLPPQGLVFIILLYQGLYIQYKRRKLIFMLLCTII